MEFTKVYTAKTTLTHTDFLRALLIKLASNSNTPDDVCNATFGTVKESFKEVISCQSHVECDYSASVGYDRKEEYWDKEKKYNSTTKQYYYEDVKKTRTVTDWKPHSGHISGDASCLAFNEEPARTSLAEHTRIAETFLTLLDEDLVEEGKAVVSHGGLETAKNNCEMWVISDIRLPGDHSKDLRTNASVEVKNINCFILPFYELDFTYNGKTYHASGFACGKPNAESELPPNNVDIEGTVNKETKPLKIGKIISWVVTPVLFFLACILSGFDINWTWLFFPIALATAITLTILHRNIRNKKLSILHAENKAQKLDNLKSAIAKNGYAKLSSEELKLFD